MQNREKIKRLGEESCRHILDIYNVDIEKDWKGVFDSLDSKNIHTVDKNIYSIIFEAITTMHVKGIQNAIDEKEAEWRKKIKK